MPNVQEATASKFCFGTKAQTLARLAGRISLARLCRQIVVRTDEWKSGSDDVIQRVLAAFPDGPIVVRSSMEGEDSDTESHAGAYESVTDVQAEPGSITEAVHRVIASYGDDVSAQEILIQEMIQGVAISGVILSRDLDTGAPYYVINYDDFSGRTDTVTGGAASKTIQVQRSRPDALKSDRMRYLVKVMDELEAVTGSAELDVEFCAQSDMTVYVLQVRPLAAKKAWDAPSDDLVLEALSSVRDRVTEISRQREGIVGTHTILGVMPDWNPAEMIGRTPRRLSASLYERLITNSVWADARTRMGYRDVNAPLMHTLVERPYIDVRLSLNSFLPATIEDDLAGRLVNWQLDRLVEAPALHDKIEFGIAATCLGPSFSLYAEDMRAAGFGSNDIAAYRDGLQGLTARAMEAGADGIKDIAAGPEALLTPVTVQDQSPLDRADEILRWTAEVGTLPFSILARHAFIAVAFLKGLVQRGAITENEAGMFLRSVRTVAADLRDDMSDMRAGRSDRESFLATYGHLRPGTYDIQAWRYDERPDLYLANHATSEYREDNPTFFLGDTASKAIEECLAETGINLTAEGLMAYMSAAISARERAKFAFTRGVSDALQNLCIWGENIGLEREDLANIRFNDMLEAAPNTGKLKALAKSGREGHRLAQATLLHHLIKSPDDTDVVYPARGEPTFIGNETVVAPTAVVSTGQTSSLDGKIVLIESADPGYDWIFTYAISGLVTKYGGANSHMAIRCAEFGLPAAIGCGERIFGDLRQSRLLELDCRSRRIAGHE